MVTQSFNVSKSPASFEFRLFEITNELRSHSVGSVGVLHAHDSIILKRHARQFMCSREARYSDLLACEKDAVMNPENYYEKETPAHEWVFEIEEVNTLEHMGALLHPVRISQSPKLQNLKGRVVTSSKLHKFIPRFTNFSESRELYQPMEKLITL